MNERLGDFEVLRELGRGGMGIVYEARQVSLNRKVALKVLSGGLGLTGKAVTRFKREAEAAAKLHHTNIVPIYATGEEDGTHFYAMELIEGPSLDKVIKQMRREAESKAESSGSKVESRESRENESSGATLDKSGTRDELSKTVIDSARPTLDAGPSTGSASDSSTSLGSGSGYFDTVARMIAEVADGLEYAHKQGVIHRDIKPSNLLLSTDGRLHINDFGLARMLEEPGMTMSGEFVGSPLYMSPEQITAGRVRLDHRTDIYSLGATLYQLLTFQPPFSGESRDQILSQIISKEPKPPRAHNRKIPLDLETICLKAMEKDPDRRYQTAGALAEDLRRFVNRFAISARRTGMAGRTMRWARRHPAVSGALAGCLVLAACAVAFAIQANRSQRELLAEKRQRALEAAVAKAMSGDSTSAETAIKQAEVAGVSLGEVRMLRGLVAFQFGRFKEAIDELEQAVKLQPNSVAAHSLLAIVANHDWRWPDYIAHLERAEALPLRTPEDRLFKGFALSFIDAVRASETLNEAIRLRDTGIGRAIRAEVRTMAAFDTGNPKDAEQALLDLVVAKETLPNHPFVLWVGLWASLAAADAYEMSGQLQKRDQILEDAQRDAQLLESFIHMPDPAFGLWAFWCYRGEDQKALQKIGAAAEQSNVRGLWLMYALSLFREGDTSKAAAVYNGLEGSGAGLYVLRILVTAELNPNLTAALKIYDEAMQRYDTRNHQLSLQLALLGLGQVQRAVSTGQEISRLAPADPKFSRPFWKAELQFLCAEISEDEFIRLAGTSLRDRSTAYWWIGMKALGEGNRAKAREYFQKAAARRALGFFSDAMSWALLKRMERDPNWPPWIPVKNDAPAEN